MNTRTTRKIVLVVGVVVCAGSMLVYSSDSLAQQPSAEQLLNALYERYRLLDTFRTTVDVKANSDSRSDAVVGMITLAKPNKLVYRTSEMAGNTVTTDGVKVWRYLPLLAQYTEEALSEYVILESLMRPESQSFGIQYVPAVLSLHQGE